MAIGFDGFNRITIYGLGTGEFGVYTWDGRDTVYATATDSLWHVDGQEVVIPGNPNAWDSYTLTGFAQPTVGYAQFDVYLPSVDPSNNSEWLPTIVLNIENGLTLNNHGWTIQQDYSNTSQLGVEISPAYEFSSGSGTVIPITGDNWFRTKAAYDMNGGLKLKFWQVGTAEPDWQATYVSGDLQSPGYGDVWIDFYFAGTSESYFTNLIFNDTDFHGLTADAYIFSGTVPGSFTANAVFVPAPHFPADAVIVSADTHLVIDTFTRTTSFGIGGDYQFIPTNALNVWGSYNFNVESSTPDFVDGSELVLVPSSGDYTLSYFVKPSPSKINCVSIDFLVGPTWNVICPRIALVLADPSRNFRWVSYVDGNIGPNGAWILATDWFGAWNFNPTPNSWYTLVMATDDAGHGQVYVTPQGSGEAAALQNHTGILGFNASENYGDIVQFTNGASSGASTVYVDNLTYWTSTNRGFTADALIERTSTTGFTADAWILPHFTADAFIAGHLTANARIGHFVYADALISERHVTADAAIVSLDGAKHFRSRDHQGQDHDTYIQLDQAIAGYPAGTMLRTVLVNMLSSYWESHIYVTAGASTSGTRNRHTRADDHYGFQPLSSIVTSADIGNPVIYPAGTPISTVIEGLLGGIVSRSFTADANIKGSPSTFITANAYIGHLFSITSDSYFQAKVRTLTADAAIIFRRVTADARLLTSTSSFFTADAIITRNLRANAVLRKTQPTKTFTADATMQL